MGWRAFVLAVVLSLAMLGIPITCYLKLKPQPDAYELSQVVGSSLGVAVAAFMAVIGLAQYRRNSREKRIERSMSFWQRANSEPFMQHFRSFVESWVKARTGEEDTDLGDIADSDDEQLHAKLSIEHVLDFYDEACTSILMRACDEEAMYSYLGPLMLLHADRLKEFMTRWRKNHQRPEKWDCFAAVMKKWEEKRAAFEKKWKNRLS